MLSYFLNQNTNFINTQEIKTKPTDVASYPISLANAKRHLRLDNDFKDDDAYIEQLIMTATRIAENFIEKDIVKTLTELHIDNFNGDWIRIEDGNFISFAGVTDKNDVSIGTLYQTARHNNFFQVQWVGNINSDPTVMKYYTGFEEETTPPEIKQAILMIIGNLYDNQRSDINWGGLVDTKTSEKILAPHRIMRV